MSKMPIKFYPPKMPEWLELINEFNPTLLSKRVSNLLNEYKEIKEIGDDWYGNIAENIFGEIFDHKEERTMGEGDVNEYEKAKKIVKNYEEKKIAPYKEITKQITNEIYKNFDGGRLKRDEGLKQKSYSAEFWIEPECPLGFPLLKRVIKIEEDLNDPNLTTFVYNNRITFFWGDIFEGSD